MAKKARNEKLNPIDSQLLYPLPVFMEYSGMSNYAVRMARRRGMRVLRVGGRGYVLGSDFITYAQDAQSHNE